jgi:hypothetical protein
MEIKEMCSSDCPHDILVNKIIKVNRILFRRPKVRHIVELKGDRVKFSDDGNFLIKWEKILHIK